MPSPLSFNSTENFRKKLLVRNLQPYNSDGFVPTSSPGETGFYVNDQSVSDSTEVEVIGQEESKNAYTKNTYGPDGGFNEPISVDDVFNTSIVSSVGKGPYGDFIASTYNSFSILTSGDPQGDNGSLSQDSDLARIAAESLKSEFQYRVAQETYQQTLGRVNAIDALSDPFDLLGIVTGNNSIIERDWKISVPKNIIGKGLDFISRITGVYSPYSWIPGDYFSDEPRQLFLNQAANAVTGLFDKRGVLKLPTEKTGMQTFLDNTGGGQRSRLFKGLSLNRYVPDYNKNFLTDLFTEVPKQNYYVGSSKQELRDIVSPAQSLPLDQDGNKSQTPVFGYDEVAKIYENEEKDNTFKFGLNQVSTYDSGGVQGGFTWVSPKRKDQAGQKVGRGGEFYGTIDPDWTEGGIQNTFQAGQSVDGAGNYQFTKGSILDNTQKLINSADEVTGVRRLQHVGNAINQVSKVFHDGTRELTKGSRVIAYVDENDEIVGKEYCRVFTKDTPYYSMGDLQKGEGITTANRKFTYSVLDNTYNLNIAPIRGNDTTNLTGNDFSSEGVKKYMFSLENLAWRTSRRKGLTYQDLPHCERGPNGGRIMWFPPYDMKVSETNSANWNANEFVGRPEPIYTYSNTTRQGSLSWKIVVDHPSILNAIVDKELAKESDSNKVNGIVDSFFAGCRKYDIYELATRFPQFTYQDIYDIITTYPDIEIVKEEFDKVDPGIPGDKDPTTDTYTPKVEDSDYQGFAYYFHNDIPDPNTRQTTTNSGYTQTLALYNSLEGTYIQRANNKSAVTEFFSENISTATTSNVLTKTNALVNKIVQGLEAGAEFTILLQGSASSPNTKSYNVDLSKRRIDSVKDYLLPLKGSKGTKTLEQWISDGKLTIKEDPKGEENNIETGNGQISCTKNLTGMDKIYSTDAMYCRRVRITNVIENPPTPPEISKDDSTEYPGTTGDVNKNENQPIPIDKKPETKERRREEVAKIIVKKLLTECDYFDLMKEESPMVYSGIKEKIKYFQPAFHSITPEGLNSRLTFLQQCIRPGDTIPVIGEDGRPTQMTANNTSFGAPPICVLRIGDFYHSKIAINQISINYEPLTFDMNPEGIGVQPMLADINMSFYFIGGQGLKEPVSRLQNALSFNYYANTEVYDDRSVVTEQREELNAKVWEDIENNLVFLGQDERALVDNQPNVGTTIGQITSEKDTLFNGEITNSGDTSYKTIVDEMTTQSKAYVDTVVNTFAEISNQYSFDGLSYFTSDRNYTEGKILGYYGSPTYYTGTTLDINLFGKPQEDKLQTKIDTLFTEVISDIENDLSPFTKNIENQNFSKKDKKKFKFNLTQKINQIKASYGTKYFSSFTDMNKNQLSLISNIDKVNFILTNTDGFQTDKGQNILLDLTGSTNVDISSTPTPSNTYEEMENDINVLGNDLQNFYNEILSNQFNYIPKYDSNYTFSILDTPYKNDPAFVRLMHVCYKEISNNSDNFVNDILGEDLKSKPEWVRYVNKIVFGRPAIPLEPLPFSEPLILGSEGMNTIPSEIPAVKGLRDIYYNVSVKTTKKIDSLRKKPTVSKYSDYSPFSEGKERVFEYTQLPKGQNNSDKEGFFISLNKGVNVGTNKTFNGKISFK